MAHIIDLIGVVEDGTTSLPGTILPADPRVTIKIPSGIDVVIRLSVFTRNGSPFSLRNSATSLVFRDKPYPDGSELVTVAGALVPAEGPNRVNFGLGPTTALAFPTWGKYLFDITADKGGSLYSIFPLSAAFVMPSINAPRAATPVGTEFAVFWGTSASAGPYNAAFITGLANSLNGTARQRTVTYNAAFGEHAFIAYPTSWGGTEDNFVDSDTLFAAGFTKVATGVSVAGEPYDVWKSNQPGLGAFGVSVT